MTKWLAISTAAMALGCKRSAPSASTPIERPTTVAQPCKITLSNLQWQAPKIPEPSPLEQSRRSVITRPAQDLIDDRK